MSSTKDRQRAAARARLEKEMAERASSARKRRQRQAIIGSALAVVVIAGAAFFIVQALKDDKGTETTASPDPSASTGADPAANLPPAGPGTVNCVWTPSAAEGGGGKVKDVGLPPVNVPNTGKTTLTFETNLGAISADIDLSKAPCTGASFKHLAEKKFLDNTKCHRLVNKDGFKVLQCGDPFATGAGYRDTDGTGGPSYTMVEENLPTNAEKPYPAGSIAMANTGQPGSTGSQFFICSEDTVLPANYTLLGTINKGLDIVRNVVKAGDDGAFEPNPGGGRPKTEVVIKTMTLTAA
ncbi:peptidyl-prolyl cis-trans isomerase B (cyclophilin B) [Actinoplanes philippinensis]|uniref:Peptidyl-prolyl cis-trans isomerase B (Cyclophilin B) n=1 Tax=Actinoplanes philippinensis TaxID=35752 RepID=A0A1I2F618_9ACTN|nr:peptidyl-prolyl cis-trans isomerase B (cyclophilin B) [Actinoplanes philippinensis]